MGRLSVPQEQPKPLGKREDMVVIQVVLIRHAEPRVSGDIPATEWPLTELGRNAARALERSLKGSLSTTSLWTSPERKARETAALAFPSLVADARDELREIERPWYSSADEYAEAADSYLRREAVEGWERREDVTDRIERLNRSLSSSERHVLVSHGLFITAWLDHEIGLDGPLSFWSDLQMPDAWEINFEAETIRRIS
jgi:broad specificity phosphatase PhoE